MQSRLTLIPFFLALAFALTPWSTPALALAIGILLGIAGLSAFPSQSKTASKYLIQASIILLGFWISLADVARAGLTGLAFSTGAIILVLVVSEILFRLLRTDREVSSLLSAGTAICGGSAIAATGQVLRAAPASIALSTAIVFLLNAAGVYAYPFLGRAMHLSERQFGAWAAVGVHDVAGVIAASAHYLGNDIAQQEATVIKLTRVLWIVPVALALGWWSRRQRPDLHTGDTKAPFPWFVLFFVAACLLRAGLERLVTDTAPIITAASWFKWLAGIMLSLALLLIGTGMTRKALATLGWRPAAHATILWLIVSAASLLAARHFVP